MVHISFCPDRNTGGARGRSNRPGDCAHSPANKTPEPAMAVNLSHDVMQEDIGGAGSARPGVGADHAIEGQRYLQLLGFKPFLQKMSRALSKDLDVGHAFPTRHAVESPTELPHL